MPFVQYQEDNSGLDLTCQSIYEFEIGRTKYKIRIKAMDQKVKQIHIQVQVSKQQIPQKYSIKQQKTQQQTKQIEIVMQQIKQVKQKYKSKGERQKQRNKIYRYEQVVDIWDFISYRRFNKEISQQKQSILFIKLILQNYFSIVQSIFNSQSQFDYKQTEEKMNQHHFNQGLNPNSKNMRVIQKYNQFIRFTDQLNIRKVIKNPYTIQSLFSKSHQSDNQSYRNNYAQINRFQSINSSLYQSFQYKDHTQNKADNQFVQVSNDCNNVNFLMDKLDQNSKFLLLNINIKYINWQNKILPSNFIINLPLKISKQQIISQIQIQTHSDQQKQLLIQQQFFSIKNI